MAVETSDYYALGIPIFMVAIAIEAGIARRRGRSVYRLADTLSNLACGLLQILAGTVLGALTLGSYRFVHDRFALVRFEEGSLAMWVIAFLGVDFCYYWFHRSGHERAIFWAIHAVHHQSEEMNVSVALRQPALSDLYAVLFYWPLPIIGVPDGPFFIAVAALSLYQVTLHTRLVGRPGLHGLVFNAPSHHRVHHGRDREHLDCNYGATLIVWDRLFGTFRAEGEEEPRYGTLRPLGSFDPLRAQVRPIVDLWRAVRAARGPADRWKVLWRHPGREPAG